MSEGDKFILKTTQVVVIGVAFTVCFLIASITAYNIVGHLYPIELSPVNCIELLKNDQ